MMRPELMVLLRFIIFLLVVLIHLKSTQARKNTETTPAEMILEAGYPEETHLITSPDGYITTVYRIPAIKGSTPVFIQHGLLESSADYLVLSKNKSLAYILSDQGYDVWLGNARGTTYSKMHTILSTSDPQYWDFSWFEVGLFDAPTIVEYIFEKTGEKLFFIGHSLGAAIFTVMVSKKPEINERIKAFFAMAPAVYLHHLKHKLVRIIAFFWREVKFIADLIGIHEFLGRNFVPLNFLANYVCENKILGRFICVLLLQLTTGFDGKQVDPDLTPVIYSKFPAGASTKYVIHTLQLITVDEFVNFDYGEERNVEIYNRTEPPKFNISKIQVPVAVFYSDYDLLVSSEDAIRFYNEVPKKIGIYKVDTPFNHVDFSWGRDAADLVYHNITKLMSIYKN